MGITPMGVQKRIKDMIDGVYDIDAERKKQKAAQAQREVRARCPRRTWRRSSSSSRSEMLDAAKNLEFERAAEMRDRLYQLKEKLFGVALPTEV